MIRLALLRHGPTAWNRAGRIQGRTDEPLDDDARATLRGLCLPEDWQEAEVVSSPLSRATETARILTGRAPKACPELTEMDWGAWEGAKGLDLKADPNSGFRDIETWGWAFRPPGGETPHDVAERVRPWALSLERDTLAVCHIGIMRVLMALATGWAFDGPAPFRIKRNRLYVLGVSDAGLSAAADPIRLIPKEPPPCG